MQVTPSLDNHLTEPYAQPIKGHISHHIHLKLALQFIRVRELSKIPPPMIITEVVAVVSNVNHSTIATSTL